MGEHMSPTLFFVTAVFLVVGLYLVAKFWGSEEVESIEEDAPRDDPDVIVAHGGPLDGLFIEMDLLRSDGQKRLLERGAVISLSEWNPYLSPSRTPNGYSIQQLTRSEAVRLGYRSFA